MVRSSPEERFTTYVETTATDLHPVPSPVTRTAREFVRTWSGQPRGRYPVFKDWKNHVSYTQHGSRKASISMREVWAGRPDLGWGQSQLGWYGASPAFAGIDEVSHDPSTVQIAKNALMDKIADRKVNLFQAYGERKQVERLLIDVVKKAATSVKLLKRGNVLGAFKVIGLGSKEEVSTYVKRVKAITRAQKLDVEKPLGKWFKYKTYRKYDVKSTPYSIADHWLALQYGLRPLYSDVVGAAELLAQRHFSRPQRFVFTHKTSIDRQFKETGSFYGGAYAVPGFFEGSRKTTAKYVAVYELGSQLDRDQAQTGMGDILTLGWELTPWSFVVDWALPIGAWLSRLNYARGLTHVSTLEVLFSEMKGTLFPVESYSIYSSGYKTSLVRTSSGSFTSNAVLLSRSSGPAVTTKFPEFKNPFSTIHTANALALLLGRLKVR